MDGVTLRSARLVLSIPTLNDVDAITAYCQDPLFEQWLTTPWPYTRADAVGFIEHIVDAGWDAETEFTWGIRSASDEHPGPLLGVVGWRSRGDIGFWTGASHRGRGYMTEAVGAVADWVFATGLADRMEWETLPGNVASARVARSAGFRYTGVKPTLVPARDGSTPNSWSAELSHSDDRAIKPGWPEFS